MFIYQVLDHLQYEIDGYYQTRLRYYHDRKTNHDTTELMSYCCPELIHIYLDSPDPGVTKSVFKNHAGKLKNFKVSRVNCQVHTYLSMVYFQHDLPLLQYLKSEVFDDTIVLKNLLNYDKL